MRLDSSPTAIQSKAFLARLLKDDWIVHMAIKAHTVEADCFWEALQAFNGILIVYYLLQLLPISFFHHFTRIYAFTQTLCHA